MSEQKFVWDPDNKGDLFKGYIVFFGTITGMGLINFCATVYGAPKTVSKRDTWKWTNVLVSWVHGGVCGVWDFLCFYYYPEIADDLVHHITPATYYMVAFSTGYFVYDFLDLIVKGHVLTSWEVTVHHIAVASMFWYNFHMKMCIGFTTVALLAEINSFFLHSRKLLQMLKVDYHDKFYRGVCVLNIITFIICRFGGLWRINLGIFNDRDMVPLGYYIAICISIFILNVINPILFWRLLYNDIIRPITSSKPSKKQEQQLINGNNNQSSHIKSS